MSLDSSNENEDVQPLPHPRPQTRREEWTSLNGEWQFSNGRNKVYKAPGDVEWESRIRVPFSPETAASGINDTGFYTAVWYRRTWEQPRLLESQRLLVHFEAVDWRATVWVNGKNVCSHEGGYTAFSADITEALIEGAVQEIVVRADDDYADLAKSRGKQDWKLESHSIWYPRTTGIWQTVWLETVNATRISSLHWSSSLESWDIGIEATILDKDTLDGEARRPLQLSVCLTAEGHLLAQDTYRVIAGEVHRRIALSDPGIDDYRNALLWSPSTPTLIDARVELHDADGKLLDSIQSYTALRTVETQGDRFILNGRPYYLRMVLDQGYWPNSGLTAENDDALVRDIKLVKQLGFNGVRKHQKIECARYLYWADRLGLLVWEEMPSAYRYTTQSIHRLTREWLEVLDRDRSHPCIVAWVPFNESWGVPSLPDSAEQRHFVQTLYHLTKAIDKSRPVIGNDGWESVATDIIGIHDYDDVPARIGIRYGNTEFEASFLSRERPGGRALTLGVDVVAHDHPIMLTEFGGIALDANENQSWGYSRVRTPDELLLVYGALLKAISSLPRLAGFCYTQFADTYQEANGLLYADRTPKASIEAIAQATTNRVPPARRLGAITEPSSPSGDSERGS